jgi:hypothetical protein
VVDQVVLEASEAVAALVVAVAAVDKAKHLFPLLL